MSDVAMNMERFRSLAETHGGDLSRWPSADIKPAATLAATSAEAAAILEAERLVDRALDAAAVTVDDERLSRVMGAINRRLDERAADGIDPRIENGARSPPRRSVFPLLSRRHLSAGFLTTMAVLGMVVGALNPHTAADTSAVTTASLDVTDARSVAALYDASPRYFVSWNQ